MDDMLSVPEAYKKEMAMWNAFEAIPEGSEVES
jgi:hypothetical protein